MISYLNNRNFNYVEIDGKYYIGIKIVKFSFEIEILQYLNMISSIVNGSIVYLVEKADKENIKKDIVMKIGNNFVEIEQSKKSQLNYQTLRNYNNELLDLKSNITVNNTNVYGMSIYMIFSDYNLEVLNKKVNEITTLLFVNEINSKRMNFEHLQAVRMLLPCNNNKNDMYITSESLGLAYPFLKAELDNENGIYIGNSQNDKISIDFMNKEYKNTNTLILGTSGTGKSFLIKSIILKNISKGIVQVVIDAEGEYTKILKKFDKEFEIINFNLIDEITQKEVTEIENKKYDQFCKKIELGFKNKKIKGLLFDLSSFNSNDKEKIFRKILIEFSRYIEKKQVKKKIIYIDELWKYISNSDDNKKEVINIFKTIRKRNGAIVIATQEVNDIFNDSNNELGKSILNNSNFKFIFAHKYIDNEILKLINIKNDFKKEIMSLPKGVCIAQIEDNEIILNIKTFDFERNLIDG